MAQRILYNSGEEIDQAISGAYLNIIVRGSGFVRDTGVQNISGQKFFFDTITFYSGLNLTGDFVPSGDIAGHLTPKTDNLYDLGSTVKEWRNLFVDGTGRLDSLHVDESASVSGNLFVSGNITGSGDAQFRNLTLTGDFVPSNFAAHFIPKTDDTYDIGSSASEVRNLFVDGTGRIDRLVVDETASIASGLNVSGSGSFGTLFITGTGIPTSTGSAGTAGQIVWGSGYLYVCTGTNLWARTHLTGWT